MVQPKYYYQLGTFMQLEEWSAYDVQEVVNEECVDFPKVVHQLRIALTSSTSSPSIHLLGKAYTVNAINKFRTTPKIHNSMKLLVFYLHIERNRV